MFNAVSNSGKRKMNEAVGGSEQFPSTAANHFSHHFASPSTFHPPPPTNYRHHFSTPSSFPPPPSNDRHLFFASPSNAQILNTASPAVRPVSFTNLLMSAEDRHPLVTETRSQIEQIFKHQTDNLRESVNGMLERQRQSLHHAADEHAAKKMKHKETEFQFTLAKNKYLEAEAERYMEEGERLSAEMRNLEVESRSLRMSLDRVYAERRRNRIAAAEESTCSTMLGETGAVGLDCKFCETQPATVMMLPCRHVSACVWCNDVINTCPACWKPKKNSVQIVLSKGV